MSAVLDIVDADMTVSLTAQFDRDEVQRTRAAALQRVFAHLGVPLLEDDAAWEQSLSTAATADMAFLRIVAVPKGRRMLARVLPHLPLPMLTAVYGAVGRHLGEIARMAPVTEQSMTLLLSALHKTASSLPASSLVAVVLTAAIAHEDAAPAVAAALLSDFATAVLVGVLDAVCSVLLL